MIVIRFEIPASEKGENETRPWEPLPIILSHLR